MWDSNDEVGNESLGKHERVVVEYTGIECNREVSAGEKTRSWMINNQRRTICIMSTATKLRSCPRANEERNERIW